ncbi:hypothetical protein K435DRAFT_856062 [Dendrothele bispora CBS 962.96]|uniref:Uncharacterized protein n=1 Tax=Dendrothele bispora (strain CBS 962.96) TaxID=1314807 RepID=A0A4S8M987_DENBC|nr:hypothetical protein K435DRAFT_856062 [Dendrothele bispora CBS 962.96]
MSRQPPQRPSQNRPHGSSTSSQTGTGTGGGGHPPPPPTSEPSSTQDATMDAPPNQHQWTFDTWTGMLVHNTDCPTCNAYRQHVMRHADRREPSLEAARVERESHFVAMGSVNLLRDIADRNREVVDLEREVGRLRRERDDARWWRSELERRLEERDRAPPTDQQRRSPRREMTRSSRRSASPRRFGGRNESSCSERRRTPPPTRNPAPEPMVLDPIPQQTQQTAPHPIERAMAGSSEESEDEDSEEEKRKKRRKLPKPPKLPNRATAKPRTNHPGTASDMVVPNDQRLVMRAPTMSQLAGLGRPASSSGPFTFKGVNTVAEAQQVLTAAETPGNWGALHQAQRVVAVTAIMNHDGRPIPPGAAHITQHWRRPRWLQDAQSLRATYEDDDCADFTFGVLPAVPQRQSTDPIREQAPWIALYASPWTHTGVHVSTGFQVDLVTLMGNNLFRMLHPRSGRPARQRFMYMFVELASQPFLYEQLLQHWNVTVATRESLQPVSSHEVMAAGGRFSMESLVRELARRGITAERMNSINDWGIQFLADAINVFPEAEAFWRQLQWTASHRLRDFGRPPVRTLEFNRNWSPPEEWNLAERGEQMAQERLHCISLNGQTTRGTRRFRQKAGENRQLARTEKFSVQHITPAPSRSTPVQHSAPTTNTSASGMDTLEQPPVPQNAPASTESTSVQQSASAPLSSTTAQHPNLGFPSSSTTEMPPPGTEEPNPDADMADATTQGGTTVNPEGLDET